MTERPDDASVQQVLDVVRDLSGDGEVTSEDIAGRTGLSRLEVEQALKHLFEQDRLTATFFPDKPAVVSEVS